MIKKRADIGIHMQDIQDFNRVYRDYFPALCFFARKTLVEHEQDVVNMLFVKLWNNAVTFTTEDHCRNYLYKAVHNACMDEIKARQHSRTRENLFAETQGEEDVSMEEMVIETEYWAEIYREMASLPQKYASVLELSYMDSLKNDEIARKMSLSVQTAKNQKSKAVKMLRLSLLNRVIFPVFLCYLAVSLFNFHFFRYYFLLVSYI